MAIPANVVNHLAPGDRAQRQQDLERVAQKFTYYFEFTAPLERSVPLAPPEDGHRYPPASILSDVTMLWSLYAECHQIIGGHDQVADVVANDPYLRGQLRRLVEADGVGSFWHFPDGVIADPTNDQDELRSLVRTLRNGYAHFRWAYDNVDAAEYWRRQGWNPAGPGAADFFRAPHRGEDNYMLYIADATTNRWNPAEFWSLPNLRIIVSRFGPLRYRVHSFLNYLLHDRKQCIFGHNLDQEV